MSVSVELFSVIEPPTSGEVTEAIRRSLDTGTPVHLELINDVQEIPARQPLSLDFRVVHTTYPGDGSRIVSGTLVENGEDLEGSSLIVETAADVALRATARMVRAR